MSPDPEPTGRQRQKLLPGQAWDALRGRPMVCTDYGLALRNDESDTRWLDGTGYDRRPYCVLNGCADQFEAMGGS